jgi:hypothetical protein
MQTTPANPDIHFLIFAPGLESWVFRTAQKYWDAYHPVIYSMNTPEDISLVTFATGDDRTVAVTLVMRRDTAPAIRAAVSSLLADVVLDPLVYDTPTDLQLTLNARVDASQRFGVPSVITGPEPTRTPGPVSGG